MSELVVFPSHTGLYSSIYHVVDNYTHHSLSHNSCFPKRKLIENLYVLESKRHYYCVVMT